MSMVFLGSFGVQAFPITEKSVANEFKASRLAKSLQTALAHVRSDTSYSQLAHYAHAFNPQQTLAMQVTHTALADQRRKGPVHNTNQAYKKSYEESYTNMILAYAHYHYLAAVEEAINKDHNVLSMDDLHKNKTVLKKAQEHFLNELHKTQRIGSAYYKINNPGNHSHLSMKGGGIKESHSVGGIVDDGGGGGGSKSSASLPMVERSPHALKGHRPRKPSPFHMLPDELRKQIAREHLNTKERGRLAATSRRENRLVEGVRHTARTSPDERLALKGAMAKVVATTPIGIKVGTPHIYKGKLYMISRVNPGTTYLTIIDLHTYKIVKQKRISKNAVKKLEEVLYLEKRKSNRGKYVGGNINESYAHGGYLYKFNRLSNVVEIIDVKRNKVVQSIPIGGEIWLTLRDGDNMYILIRDPGEVRVFDMKRNKVVQSIPVGQVPGDFILDGNFLYVANYASKSVSVIRLTE